MYTTPPEDSDDSRFAPPFAPPPATPADGAAFETAGADAAAPGPSDDGAAAGGPGASDVAREDPAARERFLPIMQAQADRMARLIDDLLSLSRIELNAHLRPDKQVDVGAILARIEKPQGDPS